MHVRLWKYLWRKLSYKLLCNRVAKHWQKTWIESLFLKPQTFGGKSKLLQLLPPEEKVNRGSTASALETSVRQSPWMLSTTSLIRARRPKLGMREWFPVLPRKTQNMAKGAGASRGGTLDRWPPRFTPAWAGEEEDRISALNQPLFQIIRITSGWSPCLFPLSCHITFTPYIKSTMKRTPYHNYLIQSPREEVRYPSHNAVHGKFFPLPIIFFLQSWEIQGDKPDTHTHADMHINHLKVILPPS